MRRIRKTAESILLCLVLAASMMPVSVSASGDQAELMAEEWSPQGFHYVVNDITENTTWKSGETYVVCMHMDEWKASEVAPGATLTVQAGARIILGIDSSYRKSDDSPAVTISAEMPVRGTLVIEGTEDKPVTVSGWMQDGIHPQGFDGLSLQPGPEGGTVKADIRYCNFIGGGVHHNGRTGAITIRKSKDAEGTEQDQDFNISLDHCLFSSTAGDGSEEPAFAPAISTVPENPERWPAEISITNCTFGAEGGPVGSAVVDESRSNQHHYTIRNCKFENCRKCWSDSASYRYVLNFGDGGSSPLILENCSFVTDPTLPGPLMTGFSNKNVWGYKYYDDAGAEQEGWHSILDEKSGFGHIRNCTFDITSARSFTLPPIMSGVPIGKLDIQKENVSLYDFGPGEANFELKIAQGGSLRVAEGANLRAGDGSSSNVNNVFMLSLGKGASASGLELYESNGETLYNSFPAAQEEIFTWQYLNTSYQYEERMKRYPWEKNKWVRREGYVRPSSIAFDRKEITLTVPANAGEGGRNTYAPILTAKVSPAGASDTEARFVCAETQKAAFNSDSLPKAYVGWENLSYFPFTDDFTISDNGEWSMDADQLRFYADSAFRSSGKDRMDITVYAYTRDGGILSEEPCLIHFIKGPEAVIVTGVSTDPSSAELNVGGTVQLKPVFTPENPTNRDVIWTSSSPDIAAVDSGGLVTAKKTGSATITATSRDGGKKGYCRITVKEGGSDPDVVPVTGVSLNKTETAVAAGGNETLKATVAPSGASNQKVSWSSSDTAVAAVDASGRITGKKPGTATITVRTEDGGKTASCTVRVLFADVTDSRSFFFEPVYWAVAQGVTNGKTETTFAPNDACTRGQVVTFLWRAAGSPEPKSSANPFADVSSGAFYYKAVLWAVEKKITNGLDETTFGPNTSCTRGQVVTFLHRAKGTPQEYEDISFSDVSSSAFYYNAVRWAVKSGVTSGTSATTFSPNGACTRGHIVTFLSRAYR